MGLDYYFTAFNGETGERISLLEESRRDHYYIMQMAISITKVAGCPCLDIERSDPKGDYYFYLKHGSQRPKVYQEKGFESFEQLKKGFELAWKTKGHVTMFVSY